jgi:hypothetical protein
MLYSLDNTNFSEIIPTGANVSTYTVYYMVEETETTSLIKGSVQVTIKKGTPTIVPPEPKDLTYNFGTQRLIVPGSTDMGEMLYNIEYDGHTMNPDDFSDFIPWAEKVGTYTVYYKVAETENYNGVQGSVQVVIKKAMPTITPPQGKELAYTGQKQYLITTGQTNVSRMLYSLDGENFSGYLPSATEKGTYTIYYKVEESTNCFGVSGSVQAAIKMAPNVIAPVANTLNYNSKAQTLITAGSSDSEEMLYSLDNINFSKNIPSAVDAGTYKVYYKVESNETYIGVLDSILVVFEKAIQTISAPKPKKLTYNGKAQSAITAGSSSYGTMLYSLDGKNYSEDIPTVTNAGTYTVYYKVEETDNYDGTEGSVEATIPGTFTEEAHIAINEVDGKKYVSIDMDSDAEGEFKITEDFEAENVKFNRTFTPNAYSTIILPFTVNTAKLAGVDSILAFSGLTVDKDGKKAVGMDVVWTKNKAHKDLAANTPYMIKMLNGNLDISGAVMFKKTEEAVVEVDNEYGNWQFCGTTTYKKWEENDPEIGSAYGFAASDDEELGVNTGDFVKIAAGAWIRPMRAYLVKQPGAKKVRANGSYAVKQSDALPEKMSIVVIDHDDNGGIHTTTIGFINTRTGAIQMNRTYDLKGRSVNSAKRTAKGAYYKKAIKK